MSSRAGQNGLTRRLLLSMLCLAVGGAVFVRAAGPAPLPPDVQAKRLGGFAAGLLYLLRTQGPDGTWAPRDDPHRVGYAALPGLTLLQGGVPARNTVIRRAADFVRASAAKMDNTYEISLSILFLDRLISNEEASGHHTEQSLIDRQILDVLALRLLAGQTLTGGWGYTCKTLTESEQLVLLRELRRKKPRYTTVPPDKGGWAVLHNPAHLMEKPKPRKKGRVILPPSPPRPDTTSDNSVTVSAVLGLFAARRYGIPVERSFRLVTKRYRSSQNSDGSWSYHYFLGGGGEPGKDTMMAAGLLGLALEYGLEDDEVLQLKPAPAGVAALAGALASPSWTTVLPALARVDRRSAAGSPTEARDNDPAIARGMSALGRFIGEPTGRTENLGQPNLYFLWSLQRMGALYDLPTIGGKDWYRWGTEALLANQNAEGFWEKGGYEAPTKPTIDTCFALLFLKQRDLARMLADKLEEDPNALVKLARVDHPKPVALAKAPAPTTVAARPPTVVHPTPAPTPPKSQAPRGPRRTRPAQAAPTPPVEAAAPVPEPTSNQTWLAIGLGGFAVVLLGAGVLVIFLSRGPAVPRAKGRQAIRKRPGRALADERRPRPGTAEKRKSSASANGPTNGSVKKRRPPPA